ncbi:hypothetical protein JCM6882_006986 [Rhodosporidiobolus microsporus]
MEAALPLPPAASTSASFATQDALDPDGGAANTPSGRQKHQCIIPVKGEPCKTCKSRNRACTFEAPPVLRIRKPKVDGVEQNAPAQSVESPSSHHVHHASEAGSAALLSLIRTAKSNPDKRTPSPSSASAPEVILARTDGHNALHYISTQAFSDLTFSVEDEHSAVHPGDVAFRQVSTDAAMPVFFVSTPSLMYGTAAPAGQRLWQTACGVLAADAPARLIELYLRQTQPAFPVLDQAQFSSPDPAGLVASGVSYGLLASLLAHSTCYVFEIRSQHKHLWRQVLLSLEDEYRKPTLQTLQLALVTITSRPAINVGQNTIAMGRLICAAQLLGLHLDPSHWRIPQSERVVRKRVWWGILISDKWRSALYGRPSNISLDDCSVPLPTMRDVDPNVPLSDADAASMESFIAMCKLTLVLDTVLSQFFTVRAVASPRPASERLQQLEVIGAELVALENDLSTPLVTLPGEDGRAEPAPTGIRSFQLCKLGLNLILYRLTAAAIEKPSPAQQAASFRTALGLVQTLVEFLENLVVDEHGQFWSPYCSFIISNAGALLLRTALTAKPFDQTTRTTCGVFFTRLVVALTSSHHSSRWDVASLALDRIATLLHSLNGELPELVPLLQLFGPPNHANNDGHPATAIPPPVAPPAFSPNHPPAPLVSPSLSNTGSAASAAPAPYTSPLGRPSLPMSAAPPPAPPAASSLAPPPPASSSSLPFAAPPAEQLTSPADQADPFWWMQTEILSMPEHFGELGDVFEGWEAGTVASGQSHGGMGGGPGGVLGGVVESGGGMVSDGGAGGQGEAHTEEVFDLLRFLQGPGGAPAGTNGVH